jgi:hypothetical protein
MFCEIVWSVVVDGEPSVGGFKHLSDALPVKFQNFRGRSMLANQQKYPILFSTRYGLSDHGHIEPMLLRRADQRRLVECGDNSVTGPFQCRLPHGSEPLIPASTQHQCHT